MNVRSRLFYVYVLFLLIYAGFTLVPAPLPRTLLQYHVSATGLRFIQLSLIILLAAIWYVGFLGYYKLQRYSSLIAAERDGKQVQKISKGMLLLALWLPVSSTLSAILNYFAMRHIGFLPAATVINHYVGLIFPLAGTIYIGYGARGLGDMVRQRPSYNVNNAIMLALILLSLVYLRLVLRTPQRDLIYHLSSWMITLTIIAPYVYMWAIGLFAAYEIYRYRKYVSGVVYRKSWNYLALGIFWLMVTSIIFQYISTLSAWFLKLSIYDLLGIIYALLAILAVGFVLIVVGARRLQLIEEI